MTAAQSMEEISYAKGDDIIEQDDIGDSFFILEEGTVSVRVSVLSVSLLLVISFVQMLYHEYLCHSVKQICVMPMRNPENWCNWGRTLTSVRLHC